MDLAKDSCLQNGSWNKEAGRNPVQPQLGALVSGGPYFLPLFLSANTRKSTMSIDFGVTSKF